MNGMHIIHLDFFGNEKLERQENTNLIIPSDMWEIHCNHLQSTGCTIAYSDWNSDELMLFSPLARPPVCCYQNLFYPGTINKSCELCRQFWSKLFCICRNHDSLSIFTTRIASQGSILHTRFVFIAARPLAFQFYILARSLDGIGRVAATLMHMPQVYHFTLIMLKYRYKSNPLPHEDNHIHFGKTQFKAYGIGICMQGVLNLTFYRFF